MIPTGSTIANTTIETVEQPSLTWKLNPAKKCITGKIDGLEAIKQAVYLALQTERYQYLIYSFNYGQEFRKLVGKDPLYVQSEMKRMVQEALLQDDRITGITNLSATVNGDSILVEFTVQSEYGSFAVSQEVS